MILIQKGQTKLVSFYLTPTLTNPYYIFRFFSNDTNNETLMISGNTSQYSHFQTFTFSESGNNPLNGGFTLIPGTYDYQVYQSNFFTTSIASASSCLATGYMTITGTAASYIYKDYSETNYVYYNPLTGAPSGLTGS